MGKKVTSLVGVSPKKLSKCMGTAKGSSTTLGVFFGTWGFDPEEEEESSGPLVCDIRRCIKKKECGLFLKFEKLSFAVSELEICIELTLAFLAFSVSGTAGMVTLSTRTTLKLMARTVRGTKTKLRLFLRKNRGGTSALL